jgi:hypothetical protein
MTDILGGLPERIFNKWTRKIDSLVLTDSGLIHVSMENQTMGNSALIHWRNISIATSQATWTTEKPRLSSPWFEKSCSMTRKNVRQRRILSKIHGS